MKTQMLNYSFIVAVAVIGNAATSAELTERCYELKGKEIDLCISDSASKASTPHAVNVELRSRVDGRSILGGFPFLLISRSEDPHRNLNHYVTASPQVYWDDLPAEGGLLSRQFSPITFNGYVSDKTWNEMGQVKMGNKTYEYSLIQGEVIPSK